VCRSAIHRAGVSESDERVGRIDFGTNVVGAIDHWGGYAGFADGVSQVRRVLAVLEPVLGAVASCYVLESGRYVAVRLANMPSTNALTIGVGYVYVTPPALNAAASRARPPMTRPGGLVRTATCSGSVTRAPTAK